MAYYAKVGFNRTIYPKQGATSINDISKRQDLFTLQLLIIVTVFIEISSELFFFKLVFHRISSIAKQQREICQIFSAFGQSSMKKCDVTRLYTKCEKQIKCNTSMHHAIKPIKML